MHQHPFFIGEGDILSCPFSPVFLSPKISHPFYSTRHNAEIIMLRIFLLALLLATPALWQKTLATEQTVFDRFNTNACRVGKPHFQVSALCNQEITMLTSMAISLMS
ncbi:hypothetical protein LPW36_05260 [Jinshanibacter sp. LJY008]|uniref:Uncharacterized protein n=1 Tax=Limnobaculum eriocheiris TaxID=2897391 RepID=A0A9X1MWE6_9GAMM|nr:hypothetical protein [Limnobaculum eriocheiris]MCD1125430.1 hypothetical protein [Limnobaculum eriocheiris]